ncbi:MULTISPECIES: succinate dehydrogenase, cytochrome b556 subunit [Halocynthiibacter]|uniref:Succinate dehydrogenase cytochrome b556 subunit n=1 Tax=Halocynthiibacter halioticoli TaxID=2986804 RepID=A0AAE3LPN0_9RHOB|nr:MULTISPECIES: succinate dehydrogenase, cytochrome b556 subunit [Halocynthiibacter]MCV6823602.1 succinate dehydrogenase, cytochrome b556 subunit [Halocynthiibacter halioticoli]MCW4056603.1 succinate dehydrogenase, cytochrome b556 subunit [Halocynthiibacter sp. SDUM655004]MDE0590380.1 succinate dehydrogenase, cytochrome b556 subunit [Halocynthiibacter sp. C4]
MADPKQSARPLSPHLTVYRWQITAISSILTRITGNALLASFVLGVWWLFAAASGPEYFDFVNGILTCWVGDIIMTLSVLGIWYHFLAGLRHLYYDAGKGLDIPTAEKLGWACVIGSVVLTILTIVIV